MVAGILVVLIVGVVVADAAAKAYARDRIRAQLVSALGLPASSEVAVDVGSGSILLQALGGSLANLDVHVPTLAFGELVGAADIRATAVPLDTSRPVGTLEANYAVTGKSLSTLAKDLKGVEVTSLTLDQARIVAGASLTVLGASVPVTLGLTPSVADGRLVFTPADIVIAGQTFTAAQLTANPLFGSTASTLLQPQSLCIAQYLPKALTATAAQITGGSLIVSFSGDGAVLGGPGFTTKGSCA
ncbi:hypothetical protein BH10ACT6_BH10ACT6_03100 [soil metagenome]